MWAWLVVVLVVFNSFLVVVDVVVVVVDVVVVDVAAVVGAVMATAAAAAADVVVVVVMMVLLLLLASGNNDDDNGNETVDKKDIEDSPMEADGEEEISVAFEACPIAVVLTLLIGDHKYDAINELDDDDDVLSVCYIMWFIMYK